MRRSRTEFIGSRVCRRADVLTVSKKGASNLLISRIEINIIVIKFGGGYKQK
jgi:hypothetical protein